METTKINSATEPASEWEIKAKNESDRNVQYYRTHKFWDKVQQGNIDITNYHKLLVGIFYQVYFASSSFALAGANCESHQTELRDYFLKHADEEKLHWKWILDDLRNTGYKGNDPREDFPSPNTQAYISYNFYLASRKPVARLGAAIMLESLGAKIGGDFSKLLASKLKLTKDQVTFFLSHSSTDKVHIEELWEILRKTNPGEEERKWILNAMSTSAILYGKIYEEALS